MERHCLSLTCLFVYAKVTCQCTLGYSNKNCCSFSWSFHSNELILSGFESQAIYLGCPLEHLGPCFSSCKLKNARCGPLAAAALLWLVCVVLQKCTCSVCDDSSTLKVGTWTYWSLCQNSLWLQWCRTGLQTNKPASSICCREIIIAVSLKVPH